MIQVHADTGRSKGWALVKFTTPEQALYAIRLFNQQEFNDRQIQVKLDRANFDAVAEGTLVFCGNLPFSSTEVELAALFGPFNPAGTLLKTTRSGKSRGFALVRFFESANAIAAIASLNGHIIDGRTLDVREDRSVELTTEMVTRTTLDSSGRSRVGGRKAGRSDRSQGAGQSNGNVIPVSPGGAEGAGMIASRMETSEPIPSSTLYVSNLNWNSTDDDLFQHFCSAGVTPASAKVQMSDTNGRSKGWGLVAFAAVDEAERALNQLNKSVLDERKISVRYNAKNS